MRKVTGFFCTATIVLLVLVNDACSWQLVFCEHVAYNQQFFDEVDQSYMLGAASIEAGTDNLRVEWTTNIENLDVCDAVYCNLHDCAIDACTKVLGSVDQASITEWYDIDFNFFQSEELLRTLNNGSSFNILESPIAVADFQTKTIFWKPVPNATYYFVRIVDGLDIDADVIFQSETVTETYYSFPESAYDIMLGNSVYVEARETMDGELSGRPVNSSIFVTKFLLNGDLDGDGTVGLSDAINTLRVVTGH